MQINSVGDFEPFFSKIPLGLEHPSDAYVLSALASAGGRLALVSSVDAATEHSRYLKPPSLLLLRILHTLLALFFDHHVDLHSSIPSSVCSPSWR